MNPAIITAMLSILGVLVGATLQWGLAKRGNEHKHFLELRYRAYTDFIEVASQLVSARQSGQRNKEIELLAKLTDAKARICIYGEETVIQRLAEFFAAGASFETEAGILAFTGFCLNIRRSIGVRDKTVLSAEMSQLLFGINTVKKSKTT